MKIEIYGKKWCSYCFKAKQLCKREKLDFLYKELNKDFTREEMLEQFPGAKTFPQIIMDGKKIGGYTELAIKLGKRCVKILIWFIQLGYSGVNISKT